MKLDPELRIDMETAEDRALSALSHEPVPASLIASAIWPDHEMKAQGAGAAASRILKRLEQQGRARWTYRVPHWGWVRA